MDKKQLDKERARLLKEVRGYMKAIGANYKLKVDKDDEYPCVIIDNSVHIAKQESEEKSGLYGYYVYYYISDLGSYWEPPSVDVHAIPYGDDTSTEDGYGWFTHLADAFEGAIKFHVAQLISLYTDYLAQVEEDKYWASLSEKEKEEIMGY